jgi:hypothetical protein
MTQSSFWDMCEFAVGCGFAAAAGASIFGLIELVKERLWLKKPPAMHVLQLCDEDGWPLRTLRLTPQQMGKLVADLDREHPRQCPR